MKHKNSTKRTLALSLLVMLLCVAMLVGTTFAWFTDSASTAVNKIQAGKLDVQLLDEQGVSLEGQTLAWQKAQGVTANEEVLWEPGCTYKLQPFKIKNNGSLALKYKIQISGIQGDAELNNVIDWTYTLADSSVFPITEEGHLTAGQETGLITISGQMQESAGNKYQGKSIDGIGITVYAAQDTVENDSYGNEYDQDAEYAVEVKTADELHKALENDEEIVGRQFFEGDYIEPKCYFVQCYSILVHIFYYFVFQLQSLPLCRLIFLHIRDIRDVLDRCTQYFPLFDRYMLWSNLCEHTLTSDLLHNICLYLTTTLYL